MIIILKFLHQIPCQPFYESFQILKANGSSLDIIKYTQVHLVASLVKKTKYQWLVIEITCEIPPAWACLPPKGLGLH